MCNKNCTGGCVVKKTAKVLLIIGGLNWGLIGLGMWMNSNLNVVHLIFRPLPAVEALIYVLVGVAAVVKIFGCRCKKCMAVCESCAAQGMDQKKEVNM